MGLSNRMERYRYTRNLLFQNYVDGVLTKDEFQDLLEKLMDYYTGLIPRQELERPDE